VTPATNAVDGNTDGDFYHGSVSHTNGELNPWWQVDLGASTAIDTIAIWNRTDCCGNRLSDYWVLVSDTPFGFGDSLNSLTSRAGVWASHQQSFPNPSITIPVNAHGRYVRIQINGTSFLHLAEVQVLGSQ